MAVFALADLHLGLAVDKPMDIFGSIWSNHAERIRASWTQRVSAQDTVLIPGDISWAMSLQEALPDLAWIAALPGRKVLLRGNHDYWWASIGRVRSALVDGVFALQNDAFAVEQWAVCGSRGWLLPSHPRFSPEDEVVYHREVQRLRLSLEAADRIGLPKLVMMHYPPTDVSAGATGFTELLEEFSVEACVYGHLHGPAHRFAFEGLKNGVAYRLVSADYLGFEPLMLG
ncbi:metallophosphoesterase [Alicyclobacillus sp. ALC3]|uniref:metallophosphoesterase n=1 Tax=Alicyclobacillus sp. ALC3 TaxID=2796143 RepID=UPI002378E2F9|nr:metallophosphoesterase [Alicyclobacillus sp. ALC3]WDL97115.1 metallophosphoesterase [Alicyclobacillus sp. ALC3]